MPLYPQQRMLPLGISDEPVGVNGTDACCTQTVEPSVAIVNDNATFNIADMSPEQADMLYAFAANETSVDKFHSDLTQFKFLLKTGESDDITYVDSADESG
ncbi:hypothetical protein CHU98_g8662 [Xylaria longipes]|nr:hypothetical protein CHU98_g8662 [Xylaria longipes]